jgi:hypothetical protein
MASLAIKPAESLAIKSAKKVGAVVAAPAPCSLCMSSSFSEESADRPKYRPRTKSRFLKKKRAINENVELELREFCFGHAVSSSTPSLAFELCPSFFEECRAGIT